MALQLLSSSTCTHVDSTLLLHLLSTCSSSLKLSSAAFLLLVAFTIWVLATLLNWGYPGGSAWGAKSFLIGQRSTIATPGPRGLPLLGSLFAFAGERGYTAHRRLAELASLYNARSLMAISLGCTRVVVASEPSTAREILCNAAFTERPLSQSARQLLFERAVGFAPRGEHWSKLRRVAASHLFSARRVAEQERVRQLDAEEMLSSIRRRVGERGEVQRVRQYLQHAALNNIMATVFGRRYAFSENAEIGEACEVQSMVREGFELLGAFNMVDHLPPAFQFIDPLLIRQRCHALVPRVYSFVQRIIDQHRAPAPCTAASALSRDFVDVLLGLQCQEQLADSDIVAVLWEMIFRGTDTMAILTEWILAELVLNPAVQAKLHSEVQAVLAEGDGVLRDADIARMPYLQAVVKEGLRMHPPGPLLSWARLAVHDVSIAGHFIPAGTTAMVNMWAITHDATIWKEPNKFKPERFLPSEGGENVDVRGSDMRLAPFGAGARACPGKALAMATVNLWVAKIVQRFEMREDPLNPVNLRELLKLSCEMEVPLTVRFIERENK